MPDNTYTLNATFTLRQPLAHTSVGSGNKLYLRTVSLLVDGEPQRIFAMSGNALRGAWRNCGALYYFSALDVMVPRTTFHTFFSGGALSKDVATDVRTIFTLRSLSPFLSLFGGAVGSTLISGKFSTTFAYPVCLETVPFFTKSPRINPPPYPAYKSLKGLVTLIRKDDTKSPYSPVLDVESFTDTDVEKDSSPQTFYDVEYLVPGAQLFSSLRLACSPLELGAFVSCLCEWAKDPVIGGRGAQGFGQVDLWLDFPTDTNGPLDPFVSVVDGQLSLSPLAQEVKALYDDYLLSIKNGHMGGVNALLSITEGKQSKTVEGPSDSLPAKGKRGRPPKNKQEVLPKTDEDVSVD